MKELAVYLVQRTLFCHLRKPKPTSRLQLLLVYLRQVLCGAYRGRWTDMHSNESCSSARCSRSMLPPGTAPVALQERRLQLAARTAVSDDVGTA